MVIRKPYLENDSTNANGLSRSIPQSTGQEPCTAQDESTPERSSDGWDTVPDTLRPGAPRANAQFTQDDVNPWDDASQAPSHSQSAPSESKPKPDDIPRALQPGPTRTETNPFKRKAVPKTSLMNDLALLESPSASFKQGQPPPTALAQMQLSDSEASSNPWQPAIKDGGLFRNTLAPTSSTDQESAKNVWASGALSKQPTASSSPAMIPVQSTGSSMPWDDEPVKPSLPSLPPPKSPEQAEFLQDQHAWDDVSSNSKGKQPARMPPANEGWNLIDNEPVSEQERPTLSRQSTWENFEDPPEDDQPQEPRRPVIIQTTDEEQPPALPPRTNTAEIPPPQPPRNQQAKSETYQIKNINWFDAKINRTRKSPILVQNVNGPCPLVALVNALTLTTPATATSNLVETLQSREQISISFLLEAVFDELMSSGRGDPTAELPDMTELYNFLKGLQTGMNVNPRFLPTPEAVKQYKRTSLGHVHPSEREDHLIPGTFEDTKDMKLYATFSVPLMHGWLPPSDDPAYDAFGRQFSSYDDVQSLLFREEELEDKLSNSSEGLTEPEQQLYQDIITIKGWLGVTATQLTPWGLEVVTKSMQPDSFAILFRNDHFTTLYRHPQTLELLTLVTDAGYHTHDEVIWESLVDVRGERSEFYSGDFRVVGGPQHQQELLGGRSGNGGDRSSRSSNGGEWQTVPERRSHNNRQGNSQPSPPLSPRHEQEDRDLALALQLQEEEEERLRNEQAAARRRQSQTSTTTYAGPPQGQSRPIPQGRSQGHIDIPVRGSGPTTGSTVHGIRPAQQQVRSLIPPRTHRPADENVEDAPPTYEQASKATPYIPPTGHPSHPRSAQNLPRRSSAGPSQNLAGPGPSTPVGRGRQSMAVPAGGQGGKDDKCTVM